MKNNQKKALIVAFYLSKYDRKALESLNYSTWRSAYEDIGGKFGYSPNSIKNRRDDFDSLNDNNRSGWYQKELSKSSLEIFEKFSNISEDGLTEIVRDILFEKNNYEILSILEDEDKGESIRSYNLRGVTGKQAEKLFINFYKKGFLGEYNGELIDTRDDGCGYDFKINKQDIVFEVKGLSSEEGGITFTDKEWTVAKQLRNNYILVLISNVFSDPNIRLVIDPYNNLSPTKAITKVVAVNWNIKSKDLESI
ncbi:hypothetical protein J2S74_000737 [Evansella vedderi]|uniref:Protein NO VEIN C-terminal domain-containing protein n=2 Tax=Evansella vedderi TaxID=38282 RepID=A0ABT9ZQ48_9BACI|nr:hypothetical protein [Evansella vedderi]